MDTVACIGHSFKRAFGVLKRNDPLLLCSSTAFFATFSLSPMIVLLVHLLSIYFNAESIGYQMFQVIADTFGPETARDIGTIVGNFLELESTWIITVGSFLFFVFVATTLLTVVKKAIHRIWRIRSQPGRRVRQFGWERGTAVLVIFYTSLLLLLSILVDTGLAVSRDYLATVWPDVAMATIGVLRTVFSVVVITVWFTIVFKLLPEAKVKWEVAFIGGFFTAIFYRFGEFLLGKVLVHARLESIFGATTSLALILLFIFYCSFILYFGAAFTFEYASNSGQPIRTSKYSRMYEEKWLDEECV